MPPANRKLLKQLKALSNLNMAPVRRAIAWKIAETARQLAPVDTGELRDSIHEDNGNVVVSAAHGVHVEFGTVFMEAQPFLRPAVDEHEREIVEAAAEQMNMMIGEAVGI
jgi:HK97 gp10 family phage protein